MNNNINDNLQGMLNNQNVQDLQSIQNVQNIQGDQVVHRKIVRKDRKRRFTRNKKSLILLGVTSIALVVATYAWFVGLRRVQVEQFEVEVVTTEGLSLSLDGKTFGSRVRVNEDIINGDANIFIDNTDTGDRLIGTNGTYLHSSGNDNHWADAGNTANKHGLEPVSSAGEVYYNSSSASDTKNSQARFFSKTALSSEKNGYKVLAEEVTGPNTKGYIAFDLFLKNATGATYDPTYNVQNDESLFLTKGSYVNYSAGGSAAGHGIENSVRVGFYALARIDSYTPSSGEGLAKIQGMSCATTSGVRSLCNIGTNGAASSTPPRGDNWNIWEPNDVKHREESITRYTGACIRRDTNGKFFGDTGYAGTNTKTCTALSVDGTTHEGYVNTYAIKNNILLSAATDSNIYDGHNDYTNPNMTNVGTLTDTLNRDEANRTTLLHIAPSSITKIRVYIWLEGQDIDNFDIAPEYQTLKVLFGFTKERYDESSLPSTTTAATTTE